MQQRSGSYDYYLILATVAVLFAFSSLCIYAMFAFKLAQVQNLAPSLKFAYMERMNRLAAPLVMALITILGICIPKRLLPTHRLNRFAALLLATAAGVGLLAGARGALLLILCASLILQLIVLGLAMAGSERVHFERSGYWLRLGSTLMHLGLILFVLDLFFFRLPTLHLALFWTTTVATVLGMTFCFYAQPLATMLRRKPPETPWSE
ncbi:MAG: hypothetical protein OEV91_06065 [Desulfobulbaceae bacterium]|nr:hypothetical protein [Desulfobulbaceae bacterium]